MARQITLYSPTVDRHGRYRDAGEVLTVGGAGNERTDMTTEAADDLVRASRAASMSEAAEAARAAPAETGQP